MANAPTIETLQPHVPRQYCASMIAFAGDEHPVLRVKQSHTPVFVERPSNATADVRLRRRD